MLGFLVLIVIIACLPAIGFVVREFNRRRDEARLNRMPCPHGIQGGRSRDRCPVCVQERQEESNRLKREHEAQERKMQIKRDADLLRLKREHEAQERKMQIKRNADLLRHQEMTRLAQARLGRIDFLLKETPQEFENTVAAMFNKLGYSVRQTPYSNDGGKDAVATKDGKKVLIECKRYDKNNLVGRPDLQKFYAAVMEERADMGIFVTTSGFARTSVEYKYVRSNLIELIDGQKLGYLMIKAFPDSGNAERYRIMCTECGSEVMFDLSSEETQKYCRNSHLMICDLRLSDISAHLVSGKVYCEECLQEMRRIRGPLRDFYRCTNYPKCRFTRSIVKIEKEALNPTNKTFNDPASSQKTEKTEDDLNNSLKGHTVIITCNNCSQKLRVPLGKKLKVTCPHCGNKFEAST